MEPMKFGFLGGGQMASALARGIVRSGLTQAHNICLAYPSGDSQNPLRNEGFITVVENSKVLAFANVIICAVKPNVTLLVLSSLHFEPSHFLISVCAGVSLSSLKKYSKLGRVARVMPNTPCMVGESASAFCTDGDCTAVDKGIVESVMTSCGNCFEVTEKQLDAVTGLSGSGPAYVYMMIEAMSDAGVKLGLPRQVSTTLAAQTVRGASTMVLETRQHPAILKDQVTSPDGTTIAACSNLEKEGFRHALISSIEVAAKRSMELGKTN